MIKILQSVMIKLFCFIASSFLIFLDILPNKDKFDIDD